MSSLETALLKPVMCFNWYVDDTFVAWPHEREKRNDFLTFLNGIHANIQFTMEVEVAGRLHFLEVYAYWKWDGALGLRIYRKPTNMAIYLNGASHHHLAQN